MKVTKLLEDFLEYFNKPISGILEVILKNEYDKLKTIAFQNIHALKIANIIRNMEDVGAVHKFTYTCTDYIIEVSEESAKATLTTRGALPANTLQELADLCGILGIQRVEIEIKW